MAEGLSTSIIESMVGTNPQGSDGSRRMSMLPQPASKSASKRLPIATPTRTGPVEDFKDEQTRGNTKNLTRPVTDRPQASIGISSMAPPSVPRLRPQREASNPRLAPRPSLSSALRRSSTAKSSNSDKSDMQARPRASSGIDLPSTAAVKASHVRSISHHIAPTPYGAHGRPGLSEGLGTVSSSRRVSLRLQKPGFTTLQQHYSPRKGPSKLPPVPTNKTSRSSTASTNDDEDIPSDPSISALQIELTHLHFLHRSASSVLFQWQASARSHFASRFSDLHARHLELKEIAHEQQTLLNQLALVEWCQGQPSSVVAERVQTLSRIIGEVETMLDEGEGGKFGRVIGVWERWLEQAEKVREGRKADGQGSKGLVFIEGVGDGWKAEAMVLERELGYFLRDLGRFGEVRGDSSLGRLMRGWVALVKGLEEELDLLQWIEAEIMTEEEVWVEGIVGELGRGVTEGIRI